MVNSICLAGVFYYCPTCSRKWKGEKSASDVTEQDKGAEEEHFSKVSRQGNPSLVLKTLLIIICTMEKYLTFMNTIQETLFLKNLLQMSSLQG